VLRVRTGALSLAAAGGATLTLGLVAGSTSSDVKRVTLDCPEPPSTTLRP